MGMQAESTRLYRRLAADPERPIAYHVTGSVRLAHTPERMDEYRHVLGMAHAQGLDYALLTPGELRERYPLIETDGLLGALWDPEDGDIDPSQLTQALAGAARDLGASVRRFTKVIGLRQDGDRWLATTPDGEILADVVINAAGYRAGEVMALLGQDLPSVAMSHQYLVTVEVPELSATRRLPLLRDPDVSYYLRQERDGFLLGPYEWQATPMWLDGMPENFAHQLWDDDLERLGPYIEAACARVPALGRAGVRRVVNGPIPYSPDGNPYLGPAHGLPNFFHANTFSFGIAQAGGAGKALAEWVIDGGPETDLWPVDPRRYGAWATKAYTVARAVELYQREYAPGFPNEERPAGRPLATSPLHARLAAKGARFGARGGWERPTWFGREPGAGARTRTGCLSAASGCSSTRSARRSGRCASAWACSTCRASRNTRRPVPAPPPGSTACCAAGFPPSAGSGLPTRSTGAAACVSEFTVARLAEDRFYLCSAASRRTARRRRAARRICRKA